jgi:putative transcriptional regulator
MSAELRIESGMLLAAWPDLMDPNFMHSVVLICQHSEQGAYGIVTNRSTELRVKELLPEHPILGASDLPVFLGGPVDHSTLQFLHVVPDEIPGGVCLDGRLWLGGSLEALARFVCENDERSRTALRLFLGYSGWSAGQLEAELGVGSWIPAPLDLEAVFGAPGEPAWRRLVRNLGGPASGLENHPPDLSWN